MASPQGSSGLYLQNAGLMLAATDRARGVRRLPLHEQPDLCAIDSQGSADHPQGKHTWVISWLYIGTFGSFIGYSAAFPLLPQDAVPGDYRGVSPSLDRWSDPSRVRSEACSPIRWGARE